MTTLDLEQGDIFELPHGRYRFHEEWDDETLWFLKEKTGHRLPLSESKLVEMLGAGQARRIDVFRCANGSVKSSSERGEFGPDEEDSEDLKRARALQFFARRWDDTLGASLGRAGLREFIKEHKHQAYSNKHTHEVSPEALYYALVNCGEPGNRPLRAFRSGRGRTLRKHFDKEIEAALNKAVEFFWELRSRGYTEAYAYFRSIVAKINRERDAAKLDPLKFPKRMETLRRRINQTINSDNWETKYGSREAHLKFEGIEEGLSATRPLELVIMDHTVVDTWVVFDTEQFLPLGRPTLTVAIDVATRCVLGYLISFEPASLHSVLTTLKRVNRNKNYMKWTFPDVPGTWDAWGKPENLLVDSGWEFKSPSLQDALRDIGTRIIWSPVRTPQYKAIGERFFRTLNQRIFHKLPGAVPAGPTEMRLIDVNPRADSVISLGGLDELMHDAIVGYHNDRHSTLCDLPAEVWKRTLKRRHVIDDITALDHILGQTTAVRLTRRGVRFKNMTFHDKRIVSRMLGPVSAKRKRRDQPKSPIGSARAWVKIKYDPIDASCIQVWNDAAKPPRYETLPNRDRKFVYGPTKKTPGRDPAKEFARPISFWHAEKVKIFAKANDLPFETDEQRWAARNRLREKWEKVAGLLPKRNTKEAIRGLAQSQSMFDRPSTARSDEKVGASDVVFATAEPSPNGMAAATLVPDQVAAFERDDEERYAQKGRSQSAKSKAKAKRTRRQKAEDEAESKGRKATEAVKERITRHAKAAARKSKKTEKPSKPTASRENIKKWLDED
ncbi:Integrase, catalytic region [Nitrobacter hamburgensis X14]|uniref:Integrase, catalytic region n=1 Tax=Nitrobacter hamburgensis (strain DSM 10229 / NCIMB 13809 / X14) TaxID=323097 RepID=Q1QNK9_NITHX|nr:DDE-type integrase/transposase/recombinase [Nitrobacter hamburgensis]ABE62188.1 Integrase, catalytic region [Nitrobacter hamburgensis X14]